MKLGKLDKLIIVLVILLIIIKYNKIKMESFPPNKNVPKIIHLIYIPWDKNQKLKDNYLDFNTKSYEELKKRNPDYHVKLWLLPDIHNFVKDNYPEYYDIIFNLPRPTMIVDFLRLLIVYHYGGIYWQYGSIEKTNMDMFLPRNDKNVKLFTEYVLSTWYANRMRNEPIRNGNPEEKIRVCNQIFSSVPKHPYIWTLFSTAVKNSQMYAVKRDYDILYIGANAMMSTVYDQVGKNLNDVELVDYHVKNRMVKISSNGSWRMDKYPIIHILYLFLLFTIVMIVINILYKNIIHICGRINRKVIIY
jgi:hypothetical protein